MTLKIGALLLVLTGLAAFFGMRAALDSGGGGMERTVTTRASNVANDLQVAEQRVRDRPQDSEALVRLASLYLQRSRENGDPSYYALADDAARRALALDEDDVPALVVAGGVALARHDFALALTLGERARAASPDVVAVYGVLTDALVELGRYDEAVAAAQEMTDRRPDFASYSRVSYLRELHGDLDGAIEAMQLAADAGSGVPFDAAWAHVITGDLLVRLGRVDEAEEAYARAERTLPGDAMVLAGRARLAHAQDDPIGAERLLRAAIEQRPLPEYAIALGELMASQGRAAEAEEQYALVRATQQLLRANGVDADPELAVFEADHGDPTAAYESARAVYERHPSVTSADALAWAAYRTGRIDEAARYMDEALRIGTRDPRFAYHAGMIALAAGSVDAAESLLVAMEAASSPLQTAAARAALTSLRSLMVEAANPD